MPAYALLKCFDREMRTGLVGLRDHWRRLKEDIRRAKKYKEVPHSPAVQLHRETNVWLWPLTCSSYQMLPVEERSC